MKVKTMKILTIVCTICLLFTMAVPAFASENYVIKAGTYRFNDVLSAPSAEFNADILFTANVVTDIYTGVLPFNCIRWFSNALFFSSDADGTQTDYYVYIDAWLTSSYGEGIQTITIPNDTEVSAEFYEWFSANALKVADDNTGDNTPPGVPGTGVTTPTMPGIPVQEKVWYNGVLLPNIISVAPENEGYSIAIIGKDISTGTIGLVFAKEFLRDYCFEENGEKYYCWVGESRNYALFDDEWSLIGEQEDGYLPVYMYDLIWCNKTIYTDSTRTETFFPKAPATLGGVVTEQMMEGVLAEVLMVLPIGLTCLIGYLALRKALSIFRRILFRV